MSRLIAFPAILIVLFGSIAIVLGALTTYSYSSQVNVQNSLADISNSIVAYASKNGGFPDPTERDARIRDFKVNNGLVGNIFDIGVAQGDEVKLNYTGASSGRLQKGRTICVEASVPFSAFIMGVKKDFVLQGEKHCGVVAPYVKHFDDADYDSYVEDEWR